MFAPFLPDLACSFFDTRETALQTPRAFRQDATREQLVGQRPEGRKDMYIGGGVLALILIVLLIIWLF
jgi:hypothetical protein